MKTIKLFSIAILLLVGITANAQTSQRGFSFQGYAVSPEGVALSNVGITARFTVYPKGASGITYTETQDLTTDAYGVFHAVVGSKNPSSFQEMNFTAKGIDYWMKVEVKKTTGGVYTTISDASILAVPYARSADNGVPVGTIISFGGPYDKIPDGWLFCNGTQYNGTDPKYHQLYSVLGHAWGGSGTNFRVPYLKGIFLRGASKGSGGYDPDASSRYRRYSGGNTGDNVGSYQHDAFAKHHHYYSGTTSTDGAHTHSMPASYASQIQGGNSGDKVVYNGDGSSTSRETRSAGSHHHTYSGNTNDTGGNETRPKNAYVIYIIKY